MILPYIAGLILYSLSVCISYSDTAKASSWYFPLGVSFSMIAAFIWMWIAKNSQAQNDIYIRGLIWDSMIVGCYTFIPFLFGVRLTGLSMLGALLVVVGLILTKVGGH